MKHLVSLAAYLVTICSLAQNTEQFISSISFSETEMAILTLDGGIRVYNSENYKEKFKTKIKKEGTYIKIRLIPVTNQILVDEEMGIFVLDGDKGKLKHHFDGGYVEVMNSSNVHPSGNRLITYGDVLLEWDLKTGKNLSLNSDWVDDVQYSKEGQPLVLENRVLNRYKFKDKKKYVMDSKVKFDSNIYNMVVDPNSNRCVFYGSEGLELRDLDSDEQIFSIEKDALETVIFSGTESEEIIGLYIGMRSSMEINRYESSTGSLLKSRELPELDYFAWGQVDGFKVIPGTNHLVLGQPNGSVHILNNETLESTKVIDLHKATLSEVSASLDGKKLAIGSEDGMVTIWDTSDWKLLKTIQY